MIGEKLVGMGICLFQAGEADEWRLFLGVRLSTDQEVASWNPVLERVMIGQLRAEPHAREEKRGDRQHP